MFNLGFGEALLIGVIALVVIGPKQLPEVARALARMINEFKKAVGDVSHSFKKGQAEVDDFVRDLTAQIVNAGQKPKEEVDSKPYYLGPEDTGQSLNKSDEFSEKVLSQDNKKDEKKS